jgi:hypothetical protein
MAENKHEEIEKNQELFRRVETTCKSRYNASSRLQWQHTFSQWTIALLSLTLIIVPLIELSSIPVAYSSSYVDVMQIILAALVLVYSLLIGTENFSRRSEKLHRCGLELGRLARQIKPYKEGEESGIVKYEELQNRYYDILEKYENHARIDFLFTRLDMHQIYYPNQLIRWSAFCLIWLRYFFVYSGHFLVIALVLGWSAGMILW